LNVSVFLKPERFSAPHRIQHPPAHRSKKNAFRKRLAGASFSRRRVQQAVNVEARTSKRAASHSRMDASWTKARQLVASLS
jgi:hypothetical protein